MNEEDLWEQLPEWYSLEAYKLDLLLYGGRISYEEWSSGMDWLDEQYSEYIENRLI